MWKIILFIERWLIYPVIFTICFVLYYLSYVVMAFELPNINYVKLYKDSDTTMSSIAHVLSGFVFAVALSVFIVYIIFYSPSDHVVSRNVYR